MEKFDYFKLLPRSPYPSRFYWWYKVYRMRNTNPSNASYYHLFNFLYKYVQTYRQPSWASFLLIFFYSAYVRSKRYTDPGEEEYLASGVLQFFSMKFSGEFLNGKPMSVYGFVAVRDVVDQLQNYVFNRSRENAYEILPDSYFDLLWKKYSFMLIHKFLKFSVLFRCFHIQHYLLFLLFY